MITSKNRYLDESEVREMGFKNLGKNVKISRTSCFYDPIYISIGDNSIIDDFCIISGNIEIGRNVHIAHSCQVIGGREGVKFHDFSGLAFGVLIFSQSDDYTGQALTNPTVPMQYRKISRAPVELGKHAIIGARSVIFPGVLIGEGSAIGAMSLVRKSTDSWSIYLGNPAKKIKIRKKELLYAEEIYLAST